MGKLIGNIEIDIPGASVRISLIGRVYVYCIYIYLHARLSSTKITCIVNSPSSLILIPPPPHGLITRQLCLFDCVITRVILLWQLMRETPFIYTFSPAIDLCILYTPSRFANRNACLLFDSDVRPHAGSRYTFDAYIVYVNYRNFSTNIY